MSSDSPSERARVFAKIAPAIMAFYAAHRDGDEWHVEQLRGFVRNQVPGIAPDSPGRILRELRQFGRLDYIVVNRRQSLYRFCSEE